MNTEIHSYKRRDGLYQARASRGDLTAYGTPAEEEAIAVVAALGALRIEEREASRAAALGGCLAGGQCGPADP